MRNQDTVPNWVILKVLSAVTGDCRVKSASAYYAPDLVVVATRRGKPDRRQRHMELVLTIGKPNFRGRLFVKACQKSGEPFPVRKVQMKWIKKPCTK